MLLLSASELARRIAAGELSSSEVVAAHIARIEEVDGQLNAVIARRFDDARREAGEADMRRVRGESIPALHGVPITIKENFHVAGTPSTLGLTTRIGQVMPSDGVHVAKLRRAGAIILGKTNLPQLMYTHETDNPVYGRTNNPWNPARSSGGSSGGEAAIIAAGGSPLGLGSDIGGSIRVPCHFCGIHGFKPTSRRLQKQGSESGLPGFEGLHWQPGPMARHVADLQLAMRILADISHDLPDSETPPLAWRETSPDDLRGLRVAMWEDDGFSTPSPGVRRAVREAAAGLRAAGCVVESIQPPRIHDAIHSYVGIISADGGRTMRRVAKGSQMNRAVAYTIKLSRIRQSVRPFITRVLKMLGQETLAGMFSASGPRTTEEYWMLCDARKHYERRFIETLSANNFQAIICPPYGLAAIPHGKGPDLLPLASYAFLPMVMGLPAGVVAATRVKAGEESDRPEKGILNKKARRSEQGSAGLPIGVQVMGLPWQDERVLQLMGVLETHFCKSPDYPAMAMV